MGRYCTVLGCQNHEPPSPDISFHKFPKDIALQNVWVLKTGQDAKFFEVHNLRNSKICSRHFAASDFHCSLNSGLKRFLKKDAVPSVFLPIPIGNINFQQGNQSEDSKPNWDLLGEMEEKHVKSDILDAKLMKAKLTHDQMMQSELKINTPLACNHRFSVEILREMSMTTSGNPFKHYTGFTSYEKFMVFLNFILPGLNKDNIVYWGSKESEIRAINVPAHFDQETLPRTYSETATVEPPPKPTQIYLKRKGGQRFALKVEDEFLMVMMKLYLGVTSHDLGIRFRMGAGSVSRIMITWVNLIYFQISKLKIWPHRDIIANEQPERFKEQYPNTMVIIDATELSIQMPSSLVLQSSTYSSYKSTNTLKSLIGVDARGGIMFVSQLYLGSISDKELVKRSGFLEVVKEKVAAGELRHGDGVMADKGFTIKNELNEVGLTLNIPPFSHQQKQFKGYEVLQTQTIAKHRVHVERAIRKVKCFRIFRGKLPIGLFGCINQIWTICCVLSNFFEPILARKKKEVEEEEEIEYVDEND